MRVFAHRGASAYAPQNTMPAFRKALELGATGVELDVQLTSDGVPVVIHDFVLDTTTDQTGFIHTARWKDLQRADAGVKYGEDFKGTPIPALEEVLALIPSDVCLNVEIKSLSFVDEDTAGTVSKLLNQAGDRDLLVSSFNHRSLKRFQELSPEIPVGILCGDDLIDFSGYVERSGLKPYSLHPEASYLSPAYVEEAHKKGWKVFSYTINTKEQAGLASQLGIDGVFSDYPDLLD